MHRALTATLFMTLAAGFAPHVAAQTAIGELSTGPTVEIAGSVSHVFGNKFVLDDGTGNVLVESGPGWHHDFTVAVGEQLRVRGEPDDGAFDAYTIFRAGGERLEIRPESGPPPWSGGRRD